MQQKIRSDSLRAPLLYLNKPSTYLFKPNPASLQSGQLADISPATADKILMAGNQQLALISLVVRNYDEAIRFYVDKLNFRLVEDTHQSETKRWVVVAPPGSTGCHLLLAQAANDEQLSRVGNQTGGRVFLFLYTDQFEDDYQNLLDKGVAIVRPPKHEPYGTVAVFEDLYGNWWDLIQPSPPRAV